MIWESRFTAYEPSDLVNMEEGLMVRLAAMAGMYPVGRVQSLHWYTADNSLADAHVKVEVREYDYAKSSVLVPIGMFAATPGRQHDLPLNLGDAAPAPFDLILTMVDASGNPLTGGPWSITLGLEL